MQLTAPTKLSFGAVKFGESQSQDLTLRNAGSVPISFCLVRDLFSTRCDCVCFYGSFLRTRMTH